MKARPESGFVAIEFSAGIALLLLPMVMLVASLPTWSEREHAATVIAREVVRLNAQSWPEDQESETNSLVTELANDLGIDPSDVAVSISDDVDRGDRVIATVTIVMPSINVPGVGTVGQWHWTTTSAMRIDRYRSR